MRFLIAMFLMGCAGGSSAPEGTESAKTAEAAPGASAAGSQHFGAAFALTSSIAAGDLLADPASRVGQVVRVEGEVADVCQKAGCWMVLADGQRTLRVTVKDHAFAVDKGATGARAIVEGTVIEKANDPDEAAHFASEANHPEKAPEATAGAKKYELVATGVEIVRG
jgi:hypothetical protein